MPQFCECGNILIHPSEGPYCSGCQARGKPSRYDFDAWAKRQEAVENQQRRRNEKYNELGFYLVVTNRDGKEKESDVTYPMKINERKFIEVVVNQLLMDPMVQSVKILSNKNRFDRKQYQFARDSDEELFFVSKSDINNYKPDTW